ncbi:hypothetical protein [Maridesulfovibrio frigidus]|uniref:hypothetical protein n=1 Tax=Maridesulfovibrio frigidus TaxID=340956 RepID=UPI000A68FE79|nr:hypothetical protein [Maridesulfovibrio frigidus]
MIKNENIKPPKMTYKATYIGLLLSLLAVGFIFSLLFPAGAGVIVVHNESGQVVKDVVIMARATKITTKNMQNDEIVSAFFKKPDESGYEVTVTFDSGKILTLQSGYLLSGYDRCDLFTITKDEITHKDVIRLKM